MADLNRSPEMTFRDYCSLIAKSVAETGYDAFRPSACVASAEKDEFHVLDVELREEGEETIALSWADSLKKNPGAVFIAFRGGKRRVMVARLKDGALVEDLVMRVNPHAQASE